VEQENGLVFLWYNAVIRYLYVLRGFEQGTDHAACQVILNRPVIDFFWLQNLAGLFSKIF